MIILFHIVKEDKFMNNIKDLENTIEILENEYKKLENKYKMVLNLLNKKVNK